MHICSCHGLTQLEIARRLGVSRPTISRLLQRARDIGLVRITISQGVENVTDLSNMLCRFFDLKEAVVVPAAATIPDTLRQTVGHSAASYVQNLLRPGVTLAISWGITLYETVKAMRPEHVPGMNVVQLVGGLGSTSPVLQSFDLARRVAELHDAECHPLHAPTREALMRDISVRRSLEMARTAQVALVGLDALWRHTSLVRVDGLGDREQRLLTEAGAAGECCFHFYTIDGIECDTVLSQQVMSLSLAELRALPLVVGVASDLDTVEAILGGLRTGVLDVLIVDQVAAERIITEEEDRRSRLGKADGASKASTTADGSTGA
ncbi:sugar-binding transcriptional regulator [Limnochorda pilosa]|uniref:Transcriptional regulator n=1 Tax=Limnochorda pilosa TaxID=1555112 RepID=A0A0K2SM09_LIMPI|nr:sugar-binding domain-containing protein [Limnochorda pilosa]BAS27869.1 transcriptional regulator [Limnochorda pilosa]